MIALNEKQSNVSKGFTLIGGGGNGASEANRQEINNLKNKINSQTEVIEKLNGEIATLKEKLAQASSNMSVEARNTINRLEGEVSSLRGSIYGLERDLKYAQTQLASYQSQGSPVPPATRNLSAELSNNAGFQPNDARILVHDSEKETTTSITQNVSDGASNVDATFGQRQTEESNKTDVQSEKPKSFIQRLFSWKK